jgi:hypothetical protein
MIRHAVANWISPTCVQHGNKIPSSAKGGDFTDHMSNYELLKKTLFHRVRETFCFRTNNSTVANDNDRLTFCSYRLEMQLCKI